MMNNLCVAHRGFSGKAPENTLAAIRMAIAMPFVHWMELDVQLSKVFLLSFMTLHWTVQPMVMVR